VRCGTSGLCHSAAVPSPARRLQRYLKAHGARQTVAEIGRRLRRLVYEEQRLIVLVKHLDDVLEPKPPGDLRFEDLRPEHLADLAELNRRRNAGPDADRRFARYVEQGFHGFVAFRDDQAIGYSWWVDRDAPHLFPDLRKGWLGIELAEGDVYGSDVFILEEHRGGGVASDFLYKQESALRDRGYRELWGYVVSSNRPARWIYSTRGYEPMWTIVKRRVGIFRRTTREDSQ